MERQRQAERPASGELGEARSEFERFEIQTHPCFLNVVLLETHPDKIVPVGDDTVSRIHRIRQTRLGDLRICWDERVEVPETGEMEDYHYKPRLHVMSGTFDLSAIFLSSSLELSAWMQDGGLMAAGQDINVALLPRPDDLPLDRSTGSDFNADFLKCFAKIKTAKRKSSKLMEPDLSFVSVIKVKLSPLTLWPEATGPATKETGVMHEVIASVWDEIDVWRSKTWVVDKDGGRKEPEVALGLSFGWSELLVVAYADSPGKLLQLSVRLRGLTADIQSQQHAKDTKRGRSHSVLTSITTLGHDFELRRRADAALKELESKADDDADPDKELPAFPASQIYDAAKEITRDQIPAALNAEDGEPEEPFIQVGCHTYPGHEWRLLKLLQDLENELEEYLWFLGLRNGDKTPPRSMLCIDSGKRDIWTPMIRIGRNGLLPGTAAALVDLIQIWIRNGGRGPASREFGDISIATGRIPDAFDFYTRVSCLSEGFLTDFEKPKDLEGHIWVLPSQILAGERLKEKLTIRDDGRDEEHDGGHEADPNGETDEPVRGSRLKGVEMSAEVKSALRALQLPYSLSEQILHVVNMLLWAHDREIVWDESVELVPPVVALAEFLRSRKEWWGRQRERLESLKPVIEERFPDLWSEELASVSWQLERSPDEDLIRLNRAFRTYFYNVHFSSYMTGEMPDLNLRYKGSVHQLLRIANLILDALTDVVLGPRASMAIIDDRISPEVSMPCHVTVVQLNSSSFTIPFMLETLAHEVAHQLLNTLDRWAPTESTEKALTDRSAQRIDPKTLACEINPWIKNNPTRHIELLAGVARSFAAVKREVFHERIDDDDSDTQLFVESASDFLEMLLLQGGQSEPSREDLFKDWAQRFLLRVCLAAAANSIDLETKEGAERNAPDPPETPGETRRNPVTDTPAANHKHISSVVTRVVVVYLVCELVIFQRLPGRDSESRSGTREEFLEALLQSLPRELTEEHAEQLRAEDAPLNLGSLLFFLRERCVTGPDSRLRREVLASWERWREWILDVLRSVVWLRDQQAFQLAVKFFESLWGLASWIDVEEALAAVDKDPKSNEPVGYQGAGRFWPCIRDAFRELWHKPVGDGSGTLKDTLLPSLYIRHWLESGIRDGLRDLKPGDEGYEELHAKARPLWRTEIQPLSRVRALAVKSDGKGKTLFEPDPEEKLRVNSLVFQRGGFRPAEEEARATWDGASRRFLARLLWMVPAWHRSILHKIEGIFDGDEPT